MSKRRFRELKEMSPEILQEKLKDSSKALFQLKLDRDMHRPFISGDFWKARKDIAMIYTIQTQRLREKV